MAERDNQTLLVSRQGVFLVTAMGMGLLTLSYVLGVQVGKQSAALRKPVPRSVDEQLQELPQSLVEQLKAFEGPGAQGLGMEKVQQAAPEGQAGGAEAKGGAVAGDAAGPKEEPKPAKEDPKAAQAKEEPKAKEAAKEDPRTSKLEGKWTLQLVTTPDADEAKRIIDRAKAAGYTATILRDRNVMRVRLARPASRAEMDAIAAKLKEKGLRPFAVKVD